jgi:hypothetical protein
MAGSLFGIGRASALMEHRPTVSADMGIGLGEQGINRKGAVDRFAFPL